MANFHIRLSKNKSRGRTKRSGKTGLFIFGLFFFLIGSAVMYFLFVKPVVNIITARSWVAVPCVIDTSRVETRSDSDGNTYAIDITFHYEYNKTTYHSDQYDLIDIATSSYSGKKAVVNRYPAGSTATCWVNPNNPSQAVISRDWSHTLWFGLIPLVFMLVGLGIMYYAFFKAGRGGIASSAKRVDWLPTPKYNLEGGRIVLKPQSTRLGKFIGAIVIALFWNGITSVFVVIAVKSHLKGDPEWFLTIFISIFVLVGIGLIINIFYQLLTQFNPTFEFTLDKTDIHLGDTVTLRWNIQGQSQRLRKVSITLIGEEWVRYQRGTNTVTDTHTVVKLPIYQTDQNAPTAKPSGETHLTFPADAMHSFDTSNNKFNWKLRVRGDIPRWPDVKNEYVLVVAPLHSA